jgi:hypothetical protein
MEQLERIPGMRSLGAAGAKYRDAIIGGGGTVVEFSNFPFSHNNTIHQGKNEARPILADES